MTAVSCRHRRDRQHGTRFVINDACIKHSIHDIRRVLAREDGLTVLPKRPPAPMLDNEEPLPGTLRTCYQAAIEYRHGDHRIDQSTEAIKKLAESTRRQTYQMTLDNKFDVINIEGV
jgi:hypothetical protein